MNNLFLKLTLIASVTFLLSSCGTYYQHSYKDDNTFYAENNACIAESNRVYPPLLVGPYGSDSNSFSRSIYAENCLKSKGWRIVSN